MIQPFIKLPKNTYFGGKGGAGVVHNIINQIPKHEKFISGFLGCCALMRFKKPAAENVGIEIDPEVCDLWRAAKFSKDITPPKFAVLQGAFLEMLPTVNRETFLYIDPPYPLQTRRSNTRYRFEMTDLEHLELLEKLRSLPCMVGVSTYDNSIYREILDGWRKIHFQAQTRGGKPATETLYMNYPEPSPLELHDPRFAGSDYREREKSKRRLNTIARKIERLEESEAAKLVLIIQKKFPHLVTSQK